MIFNQTISELMENQLTASKPMKLCK
jgi:hypothetical protein